MAAETSPSTFKASTGMGPAEVRAMYRAALEAYFGTGDDAVLARHDEAMRLLSLFNTLVFLAKSRDSKNLPPERVQGALAQIPPAFRETQPQIVAVAKAYD